MIEAIVSHLFELVLFIGLPVLFVLFYLDGLIVGKILQASLVFIAIVAVTDPSIPMLVLIVIGSTVFVTAGQWTIFHEFDKDEPSFYGAFKRVPYLDRVPMRVVDSVDQRRLEVVDSLFARYAGIAIVTSPFVPGLRGMLAIPAGISSYPTKRFVIATFIGYGLHSLLLVAIAFGIVALTGLA